MRCRTSYLVALLTITLLLWGDLRQAHAATYTVINLNDSGAGSLRQAIIDANDNAGTDTITFAPNVTGTIMLGSALPPITDELT